MSLKKGSHRQIHSCPISPPHAFLKSLIIWANLIFSSLQFLEIEKAHFTKSIKAKDYSLYQINKSFCSTIHPNSKKKLPPPFPSCSYPFPSLHPRHCWPYLQGFSWKMSKLSLIHIKHLNNSLKMINTSMISCWDNEFPRFHAFVEKHTLEKQADLSNLSLSSISLTPFTIASPRQLFPNILTNVNTSYALPRQKSLP